MKQFIQSVKANLTNKCKMALTEADFFEHLLNRKHSRVHRMFFGVIISYAGVVIAKVTGEIHFIGGICDGLGYFLHALGITPFLDNLTDNYNKNSKEN